MNHPILGLVGPSMLAYLGTRWVKIAKSQTERFGSAPDVFYIDGRRYPTTQEGFEALALAPNGLEVWKGPDVQGRPRVA
jgi:general secretion pathway protein G